MPNESRKPGERHGPSTHPIDEGLEGAIFDDDETTRSDREADLRDLDAAARGESRIASRSSEEQGGEPEGSGGR